MNEYKSAFEIDGFLEGKTEVESSKTSIVYRYDKEKNEILYFSKIDNKWSRTTALVEYFCSKIFKKSEPKPKEFIHEYWIDLGGHKEYRKAKTAQCWDSFSAIKNYERIKTTEI